MSSPLKNGFPSIIELAALNTRNFSVKLMFAIRNSTVISVSMETICPPAIRTLFSFESDACIGLKSVFSFLSSSKMLFGMTLAHAPVSTSALRWRLGANQILE